jgi:hypothetical protein
MRPVEPPAVKPVVPEEKMDKNIKRLTRASMPPGVGHVWVITAGRNQLRRLNRVQGTM